MSTTQPDPRARRDWGDDDSATNIIHIDMDAFFASVELVEDPSLQGHPVIVGGSSTRGVVSSATYEARGRGVRAGMPIRQAIALCPRARVVRGNHDLYRDYSRRVMGILHEVTPLVEQVSIDEAFLDISGARRRLGRPLGIAQHLRMRIRDEVGLPSSAGIAINKGVAKIASTHAKPHGVLLIPEAMTVKFLHGLPVGALWGVGAATRAILQREGIDTVADLAYAPMLRLQKLLGGASAHHLHDQAWGIDKRGVTPEHVEKSISTETTFPDNVSDRQEMRHFILDASHQCARRLRAGGLVAWTVAIKMRDSDFHTRTRSVTLRAPTDLGGDIARAAYDLLAAEVIPTGGVRLLGVRTENLRSRDEGVPVPLDADHHGAEAERAMDAITVRFGRSAIVPASLLAEPREAEESEGSDQESMVSQHSGRSTMRDRGESGE